MIQRTKGAQSIVFAEAPYIMSSASVVGKKESEGPLGELFDTFDERRYAEGSVCARTS